MTHLETFSLVFLAIQFAHSIEELTQGFHRKFPAIQLKFGTFLAFEILFLGFWLLVFLLESFLFRETILAAFILLMFANGIWHIVWGVLEKKYVPGLATAPLFVITFVVFFLQLL